MSPGASPLAAQDQWNGDEHHTLSSHRLCWPLGTELSRLALVGIHRVLPYFAFANTCVLFNRVTVCTKQRANNAHWSGKFMSAIQSCTLCTFLTIKAIVYIYIYIYLSAIVTSSLGAQCCEVWMRWASVCLSVSISGTTWFIGCPEKNCSNFLYDSKVCTFFSGQPCSSGDMLANR